ncbi:TetR/AcrR family transcriptional regulator [Geobacter sp. SVR]|uniref:TetR/AcrR family transcriptional regulator n=1 Tax=Geobacter sp. SVR TaxID=2495594 RepID=UPI00143EFFC4|nr:TetR/AcrR family transcriptional regulator [Geobacter sp. SVR]BCS52530.1 TetR family transcriptional regulator [Geobacter sp. SVR]GCF84033.1 TetR family transcriptional regulator [Geobacter sp. SVR]
MSKPDKRDEIIRAALELIAEQGFHGAPMAMIAERADVGAGTIYRYFENKDVLISELYGGIEEKMQGVLLAGYSADAPFRARFLHLSTALLRYFIEQPMDFRYLEQFHNSPYGVAVRRDKIMGNREGGCNAFKELFEQGAAQQVLKDLPLVILFDLAFGPLLAVARDHILGFITLDDILVNRTVEACWDAVKR